MRFRSYASRTRRGSLAKLLRSGRPYTKERLIAELEKAQATETSRALLDALRAARCRLRLDASMKEFGAVRSGKLVRIHPRLRNIETTLGIMIHEGRHALDIQAGLIPPPGKATGWQRLLAEGRAWASELEFLCRNKFTESPRWRFTRLAPRELLIDIVVGYAIEGVTLAELDEIWQNHMRHFPYQ